MIQLSNPQKSFPLSQLNHFDKGSKKLLVINDLLLVFLSNYEIVAIFCTKD